jgi:hypothetical protein
MSIIALDQVSGKIRRADDMAFADYIIELKNNKDKWIVINALVNEWAKRDKEEFKAFRLQIDDVRRGLYDKKYGQTSGDKNMERRLTVIFPESLYFMIRSVYKVGELQMDRAFYQEFAKKFPFFRVPDKI